MYYARCCCIICHVVVSGFISSFFLGDRLYMLLHVHVYISPFWEYFINLFLMRRRVLMPHSFVSKNKIAILNH